MSAICQGTTKLGVPCRAKACNGTSFCARHQVTDEHEDCKISDDSGTSSLVRGTKRAKSNKKEATGVNYSSEIYEADASEALENVNVRLEELMSITNSVKTKVKTMESVSNALCNGRDNKKTPRKPWEMTESRALNSAKWMFYNEHKNDATILNDIRMILISSRKLATKVVKVGGKEVEKEIIPHTLVKVETDKLFENLPDRVISDYVRRAKAAFEKRKAEKAEKTLVGP